MSTKLNHSDRSRRIKHHNKSDFRTFCNRKRIKDSAYFNPYIMAKMARINAAPVDVNKEGKEEIDG